MERNYIIKIMTNIYIHVDNIYVGSSNNTLAAYTSHSCNLNCNLNLSGESLIPLTRGDFVNKM